MPLTHALSIAALILAAAVPAPPARTSFRFKMWNSSEHVIQEVYVSPSSDSRWGRNLLHAAVKPGGKLIFSVPGGCGAYDLRFVAPDGIEYIREGVDFCEDDHVVRIGDRALRKMTPAQADALEAAAAKNPTK
jgi:hypothetical protein